MEIRETLFRKSFSIETTSPYITALDFMKKLSEYHKIYERKNSFETDGPSTKSTLVFDVVEQLDAFSQISINFSTSGENNMLYVDIQGDFVLRVDETGFFAETFSEFYLKGIYPMMKKVSERRVKELEVEIERL